MQPQVVCASGDSCILSDRFQSDYFTITFMVLPSDSLTMFKPF